MRNQFANNPVIAHRGAFKAQGLPENSIAALRQAIVLGCRGSELDIHLTADNVLVVYHDAHFHKMLIEKTTYADLSTQLLPNGESLPLLHDFLTVGLATTNLATQLILEIKPSRINKTRGLLIAESVVEMVESFKALEKVIFISFDYVILKRILELNPKVITQYLNGDKTPIQVKADGIAGIDYHQNVFKKNPDWITKAKENDIKLNTWTVNHLPTMKWFLANNFDFITTNEPEKLLRILQKDGFY